MVPTLSLDVSDFTLADMGNLARPTPECPMAFGPGSSLGAAGGYAPTPGAFPQQPTRTTIANSAVALARLLPQSTAGFSLRSVPMNRSIEP